MARALPILILAIAAQCAGPAGTAESPLVDRAGITLVHIPAGSFVMGSPATEPGRRADEPQRKVRITRDFYIGCFEVTRGQFAEFVRQSKYRTDAERGIRGGYGFDDATKKLSGPDKKYSWQFTGFAQTDDHPVVNVSWNDAQAFCRWLGTTENAVYRLPTEAEWEYACRAGTTTPYSNGADRERLVDVGNIVDADARTLFPDRQTIQSSDGFIFTAPVGRFAPNGFGLHDMHGNVWEWCADWHAAPAAPEKNDGPGEVVDPQGPATGRDRVIHGGDWYHDWSFARSAQRFPIYPGLYRRHGGFRVVREVAK